MGRIANLDAPLTLDPQQAITLKVVQSLVDFEARTLAITYELRSAGGAILARRTVVADGAAVQTWITNQETNVTQRLLAKLGVSGTVP